MPSRGPLFLLTLLLLFFGITGTAEARRRGVIVINYGDDFYELGKAQIPPAETGLELPATDLKVGYHCQMLGLFWMNIFTWGGEYCLYRQANGETEYEAITPGMAAAFLNKRESSLEKPWTYSWPPGMFVFGGLILLKFAAKKGGAGGKGSVGNWNGGSKVEAPERPRWTPPPPQQAAPPVLSGRVMAPALPEAFASLPPPLPPPLPPEDGSPLLPTVAPMVAGPPVLPAPGLANMALPLLPPCPAPPPNPAPAMPPPGATPSLPPSVAQPRVTPPAARPATVQKRYGGPPGKPSPPAESGRRDEGEVMLFVPWSKAPGA